LFGRKAKEIARLNNELEQLKRVPLDPRLAELQELDHQLSVMLLKRKKLQVELEGIDDRKQYLRSRRNRWRDGSYEHTICTQRVVSLEDREEELPLLIGNISSKIEQLQAKILNLRSQMQPPTTEEAAYA
jgi:chaperonin cofactor prefoldin